MALTIAGQDRIAAAHCMLGTKWRRLPVGRQTLLVVARLPKGETDADLAHGFAIRHSPRSAAPCAKASKCWPRWHPP